MNFKEAIVRTKMKDSIIKNLKNGVMDNRLLNVDNEFLIYMSRDIHLEKCDSNKEYWYFNNKFKELSREDQIRYIVTYHNSELAKTITFEIEQEGIHE